MFLTTEPDTIPIVVYRQGRENSATNAQAEVMKKALQGERGRNIKAEKKTKRAAIEPRRGKTQNSP